jgi:hypothetical protein
VFDLTQFVRLELAEEVVTEVDGVPNMKHNAGESERECLVADLVTQEQEVEAGFPQLEIVY